MELGSNSPGHDSQLYYICDLSKIFGLSESQCLNCEIEKRQMKFL